MNSSKPIILVLLAHYLPGYKCGGPIRTIANLVDHLGDEFDFKIITSDRDMHDLEPYPGVAINDWNRVGKASVYYASPQNLSFLRLSKLISETPHDLLYINSFHSPVFSVFPLFARRFGLIPGKKVVLAPRGEFSTGALAIKSFKKLCFAFTADILGLHQNLTWQASSEHEAEDIRFAMKDIAGDIVVAPNLLPKEDLEADLEIAPDRVSDTLRVVFLSRVSPMKNLDYALKALMRVNVPVEFDIYGIIDDPSYWETCQEQMKRLPGNVSAAYRGGIEHQEVHSLLRKYDLFFLPTRGENFGHVIFEALAAGVPVLISDRTPWKDLEEKGIGWVRPLGDIQGYVQVLSQYALTDGVEKHSRRQRTREFALALANQEAVVQGNKVLFRLANLRNS